MAWDRCVAAASATAIDRAALEDLPDQVALWVGHTVAEDEALPRAVHLEMHGEIRVGRWRPFTAQQILSPSGFVWAATAGTPPMRIRGFDRYTEGTGEMRWRMFGVLPVMTASGPDVTRSAAGRLAGELMLLPGWAATGNATWRPVDDHRATAAVTLGAHTHHVTVEIDEAGRLAAVSLPRWGNPDKAPYAEHPFGVILDQERTFGGHRIPTRMRAGWWYGTDRWSEGEFFRATIDVATFK